MKHDRAIIASMGRAVLFALAAMLVGCSSGASTATTSRDGLLGMPVSAARERYSDPTKRSGLRETAIDDLVAMSTDPSPQVRANSIEALMEAPSRAEPVVAAGLKDDNLGVRTVAAMAAGKLKLTGLTAAVEPLLSDPSPFVHAAAVYALRRCGVDADPTPVATMLLTDPSPRVRANAAMILGELGDKSALGPLRQSAKDPMAKADQSEVRLLRLQVLEAMVKLGDEDQVQPIRAALYPSQPDELEATALAVQIIGQVKDRGAINQLIYLAMQKNSSGQMMPAEIRLGVAGALAKMGKPEGSFIAEQFKASKTPALRAQAAYVYGQTAQIENLARLEALMSDPEATVRASAAGGVLVATNQDGEGQAAGRMTTANGG